MGEIKKEEVPLGYVFSVLSFFFLIQNLMTTTEVTVVRLLPVGLFIDLRSE